MDPHVRKAIRSAHARHRVTCSCGKLLAGNGRKAHQRSCEAWLAEHGWPLDQGFRDALMSEYPGKGADVVRIVELRLGEEMLRRRSAGIREPVPWSDLKRLVWDYAGDWSRLRDGR